MANSGFVQIPLYNIIIINLVCNFGVISALYFSIYFWHKNINTDDTKKKYCPSSHSPNLHNNISQRQTHPNVWMNVLNAWLIQKLINNCWYTNYITFSNIILYKLIHKSQNTQFKTKY